MTHVSAVHRHWNFEKPIISLMVNRNGDWVAVALADGTLRLLPAHEEAEKAAELDVHKGISLSLCADADDHTFLSGGDDGRVYIIDPLSKAPTLLAEHKNMWVDHVAASTEGYRAYSVGKNVFLINEEGKIKEQPFVHPSSIGGMAFSPNGKRLATSHYNGVSLWWPNAKDNVPTKLIWKGSHLSLSWHPDGKIIMTSLQENALHGWRLSDNNEMQMQGYAAKTHSMMFTAKGRYLATSGAEQVICWPYFAGGPWGKSPLTLGGEVPALVSQVAPHPQDELVAAGYENGVVMLAPLDGRMEMVIHPAVGVKIVGLRWNQEGNCLFAALENGYLMLFTIESVKRLFAHA